jgi:hypothetical protein
VGTPELLGAENVMDGTVRHSRLSRSGRDRGATRRRGLLVPGRYLKRECKERRMR